MIGQFESHAHDQDPITVASRVRYQDHSGWVRRLSLEKLLQRER